MPVGPNSPRLIFPKADLSLATLLPYTQGTNGFWAAVSTGVFSSGAQNLLGYLDSIVLTIDQMLLEAISVDAGFMHRLAGPVDASAVITENMRRQVGAAGSTGTSGTTAGASALDPGVVTAICTAYPMVRLQFAYNFSSSHNDLITMYGAWSRFTTGVQGIGAQKAGMVLQLIDTSYIQIDGTTLGVAPISMVRS